jgi:hypothetical protein
MAVMSVVFVAGCKSKFAIYILLRNNAVRNQTAARLLRSQKGDLRVMTTKVLWAHACLNCSKKHNTPGNQTMLIGKPKLSLTILATALIAAGCGGGGSSTSDNTAQAGGTTVSGVAAKGLIHGGRVQLVAFNSATNELAAAPVASATTGTDGGYSANVGAATGSFMIGVDAVEGTTMGDEATGEELPMPNTLTLRSMVEFDATAGKDIKAHVSPFTEMIVKTAENAVGGLTKGNLDKSKEGMIALLGFDPTKVKPVASNSDAAANATEEEKIQSLSLATLSLLGKQGAFGCAGVPAEKIVCVVKSFTGSASFTATGMQIGPEAAAAFRKALAEVVQDKVINKTNKDTVEGLPVFGQDEVPTPPVAANPVDAAKRLFADLRSNFNALALADGKNALTQQADAMQGEFKTAVSALDMDTINLMRIATGGLAYWTNHANGQPATITFLKQGDGTLTEPLGLSSSLGNTGGAAPVGSCTIAGEELTCKLQSNPLAGSFSASGFKVATKQITLTKAADGSYAYTASGGVKTYKNNVLQTTTPAGTSTAGTVSFALNGRNLASLAISGDLPARVNDMGAVITDRETINLAVTQEVEADGNQKYSLAGDVMSIKDTAAVGKVVLKNGSYFRVGKQGDLDPATGLVVETLKEVKLAFSGEQGSSKIDGALTLKNFSADKNGKGFIPTLATFEGAFTTANVEFAKGTIGLDLPGYASFDSSKAESADNFLKRTVFFNGAVTIPQRPALSVSLAANTEAYQYVTFNASYIGTAGSLALNFSGGGDHGQQKLGMSSSVGVSGDFVGDQESADLFMNGSVIATLNRKSGMIAYRDGVFESLK